MLGRPVGVRTAGGCLDGRWVLGRSVGVRTASGVRTVGGC